MEYLLPTLLCVVAATTSVYGGLVMTGCADAYIHLKCPSDETIHVGDIKIVTAKQSSSCFRLDQIAPRMLVPKEVSHLCTSHEKCIYVKDMCDDKSECAFYISPDIFKQQNPNQKSEIRISYRCLPGTERKAGIAVIAIITILAVIALVVIVFLICRNMPKEAEEDPGDYNEFENELSRTPSTASDLPTAKYVKQSGPGGGDVKLQTRHTSEEQTSEIRPKSGSVV